MRESLAIFGLFMSAFVAASAKAGNIVITNNGFEVPDLGSGPLAYGYGTMPGGIGPIGNTPGIGWIFSGGGGIAANGSNFLVINAPNGNSDGVMSTSGQAGVIQSGDGTFNSSAMTQVLNGFQAGTATINFLAEGRAITGVSRGPDPIDVYLDNILLGSVTPAIDVFTLESFTTNVTAGSHTLGFVGNDPEPATLDLSTFIDNVTVLNNPVPEPSSMVLFGVAALGDRRDAIAAGQIDGKRLRQPANHARADPRLAPQGVNGYPRQMSVAVWPAVGFRQGCFR